MAKFSIGLISGLLLGSALFASAQFGNSRFDERTRNWNEQQYQQRQQNIYNEQMQMRKPC